MATEWTTITRDDLIAYKAAAVVDSLESAALGSGQENPIAKIISESIARIRMEISAGGRTVLSAREKTIPPSLMSLACRMALRTGQSRLNAVGAMPLSDDERKEWDKDERLLERIAKGEITIESPTDPASSPEVQTSVVRPSITARSRRFGRDQQEGI